ncbi:MAG: hypothetical protein BMS9Abin09_0415 [Gammaproteobacteria bacterium]|nr:MAG: hypothetical protein BMS9Abin09_0415 [Gammaproteobacteria bacterium]
MTKGLLLCTDMDRTLLPNGRQPESPQARELFHQLVSREEVTLAYVTGRHRALVEDAIDEYRLPLPDFVICDVGTTIYEAHRYSWEPLEDWQSEIAPDWAGYDHLRLATMFRSLDGLELQEAEKQNNFKLSYYVSLNSDASGMMDKMKDILHAEGIKASLVWSVDELRGSGLLDVLPASATKFHAVEFLRNRLGYKNEQTLFAGDSGNDMQVLTSSIPSVLVANAAADVRQQAVTDAQKSGNRDALYLAKGDYQGMNGNYSAGIIEGVAHYLPESKAWLNGNARHE